MRWLFLLLVMLNLFYWVWNERFASRMANEKPDSSFRDVEVGIRLISESGVTMQAKGEGRKEECLFLGGFQSEEKGHQIVQRLLSLDIASRIERQERVVAADYWVYLAPLASRQASRQQVRELQAKKIDSYVIAQGDLINAVSLGVFSRAESAEAAVQRFRAAGYEPVVRELPRVRQDYWVRVMPESARLLDERLMRRLGRSFPGLRQQKKECEGVAVSGYLE
ncbi:SPOR domain-containing protein [Azotobacter salinestris]|uniref:SPOR domain-containing protein n=1 Tax=Azotobacter salinestris TaxID=69964 RepID=UPI001FCC5E30|nr:SPOR domain-containing protein [Azotobacter salinestris]